MKDSVMDGTFAIMKCARAGGSDPSSMAAHWRGHDMSIAPWNKVILDDEWLRHLYLEERLTAAEVAKVMDVGLGPVYRRLRELALTRPFTTAQTVRLTGDKHYNWKTGKTKDVNGYIRLNVSGRQFYEHRVVAEEKLGRSLLPGEIVHHVDGDRANNHPDNLQVLPSNSAHAHLHLTPDEVKLRIEKGLKTRKTSSKPRDNSGIRRGQRHPMAKLTESQAIEIIKACKAGTAYSELAKEYGVTKSQIQRIASGRSWPHLQALEAGLPALEAL